MGKYEIYAIRFVFDFFFVPLQKNREVFCSIVCLMIEELKVKNFLSFKTEACLSFEATKDDMGAASHVVTMADGRKLLRLALIYGANASGKSNLLNAIEFLKKFWFTKQEDVDTPTGVIPFRFDVATPTEPSEFSLRFYVNGTRYWYELKLSTACVLEEKLSYYGSVQPTMLFHRILEAGQSVIKLNSTIKPSAAAQEEIQLKCLKNTSFFAARNQVNVTIPLVDDARDWLRNGIMNMVSPDVRMFNYAAHQMDTNISLKEHLLSFVQSADFNIVGFTTKHIPTEVPEVLMNLLTKEKSLSEEERKQFAMRLSTEFQHKVQNERGVEVYSLPEQLQSRGTKRALGLESALYWANEKSAVLPVDEIESSLHPALIEYVLESFFRTNSQSQIVVTTHYDQLLDTISDLLRKDMIWFTEKKKDGSTDLYSLVEFNGLNKISSFPRSYRSGRFGAQPNIG